MIGQRRATTRSQNRRFLTGALTILGCLAMALLPLAASAQAIRLTPAQQQMLDQLPPSQRQQALQAIQQLNQQGNSGATQSSLAEELSTSQPAADTPASDAVEQQLPRAAGGSRLVISLERREELTPQVIRELEADPVLRGVEGSRYYALDDIGTLVLPGIAEITLLGLDAFAIQQRLSAVPEFDLFDITVSILEEQAVGAEALQPFGYDVFESTMAGFEPILGGPVPLDYVLGPGDTIRVQLFGNVDGIYEFEVTRDGMLNLPQLGPVTVAGLPFSEFRDDLNRRVQEMLIGTQVSVTMGRLRTIRVFVLGDVNRPGSYVVSSFATISSALYMGGGISDIGSLRKIQLKRGGDLVTSLDLYNLLLNGDTSGDQRLQPGDVIFVPPLGQTVGVSGAVRRPAIYELAGETDVADVIRLAGGLRAEAFPQAARIERINPTRERIVVSLDATLPGDAATTVTDGDLLVVPEVLEQLTDTVLLSGEVQRPGPYQWRSGMRLTDVIPTALDLNPGADSSYVLIRRLDERSQRVSVLSANLDQAWSVPESPANVTLQARDTVFVFSLAFGRQRVIEPIMQELELQSRLGDPLQAVTVVGAVRAPGTYPLEFGMRVSDVIRAGGNLAEEAFTLEAELVRYATNDESRVTEVVDIDLDGILNGDPAADIVLSAHDHVRFSTIPMWDSEWTVVLEGEVVFPGEYRVRRGENLSQVLERAGGLTADAFAAGAIFLRDSLREKEQEQLDRLVLRMESEIASLSLQASDPGTSESLGTGQALLQQLRSTEAVGRLVIDLDVLAARDIDGQRINDVELRDGDHLLVPTQSQMVTIIGEVQQATSHLHKTGLSREDYIGMSGGTTRRADDKNIYVVRANGAVLTGNRSLWFGRRGGTEIQPGDTIVVPLDVDRMRPLTMWTNITQILYQAAIAVAAIRSFN